LITNENVRSY